MACSVAPDWKGFAGPIGPAVIEQTVVKWSVLSRQIAKDWNELIRACKDITFVTKCTETERNVLYSSGIVQNGLKCS